MFCGYCCIGCCIGCCIIKQKHISLTVGASISCTNAIEMPDEPAMVQQLLQSSTICMSPDSPAEGIPAGSPGGLEGSLSGMAQHNSQTDQ